MYVVYTGNLCYCGNIKEYLLVIWKVLKSYLDKQNEEEIEKQRRMNKAVNTIKSEKSKEHTHKA